MANLAAILLRMDFLDAFQEQVQDLTTSNKAVTVLHGTERSDLSNAVLGVDFIAGICQRGAVAIPLKEITQTLGAELPALCNTTLNQFLAAQRTPVRLEYQSHGMPARCWLLNVLESWLRVATPSGVGWLPIQSLKLVRIDPVDN